MRKTHDNMSASFTIEEKKAVTKAAKKLGVSRSKFIHDATVARMESESK
jgi:uncharacterized protein (DUF1778 family)